MHPMGILRWTSLAALTAAAFFSLPPQQSQSATIEAVPVTNVSSALYLTHAPGRSDDLFIVTKTGDIRIYDKATSTLQATPFLDLSDISTNSERGLLGLAFHPNYDSNGLFYVNATNTSGDTEIRRYQRSAGNPDIADVGSKSVILSYSQDFANHNGGWLGFGPDDLLYIASGDGGSGNDPNNRAQDLNSRLGKILRIDVDGTNKGAYGVPESNPFFSSTGDSNANDDETWAYGLRNPWRASFDRANGDFYIADVGQNNIEEIDYQHASSLGGENYGWRPKEGSQDNPAVGDAHPAGAVDPVYEYSHGFGSNQGNSVTGGYVYRGPITNIQGEYFFADFVNPRIWSIEVDRNTQQMVAGSFTDYTADLVTPNSISNIASFGEDASGNLYIVSIGGGVFQVVPEPSTWALLLLGIAGMSFVAWRRKK